MCISDASLPWIVCYRTMASFQLEKTCTITESSRQLLRRLSCWQSRGFPQGLWLGLPLPWNRLSFCIPPLVNRPNLAETIPNLNFLGVPQGWEYFFVLFCVIWFWSVLIAVELLPTAISCPLISFKFPRAVFLGDNSGSLRRSLWWPDRSWGRHWAVREETTRHRRGNLLTPRRGAAPAPQLSPARLRLPACRALSPAGAPRLPAAAPARCLPGVVVSRRAAGDGAPALPFRERSAGSDPLPRETTLHFKLANQNFAMARTGQCGAEGAGNLNPAWSVRAG